MVTLRAGTTVTGIAAVSSIVGIAAASTISAGDVSSVIIDVSAFRSGATIATVSAGVRIIACCVSTLSGIAALDGSVIDGNGLISYTDTCAAVTAVSGLIRCRISTIATFSTGYRSMINGRSDLAADTCSTISSVIAIGTACTITTDHFDSIACNHFCVTRLLCTGSDTGCSIRLCGRAVTTLNGTIGNLQSGSRMFISSILNEFQSGFCLIIFICSITRDGMSAQINLDIPPGIRDFNRMVNVILYSYLIVSVIVNGYFHVLVRCALVLIRLTVMVRCIILILEPVCNFCRIHKCSLSICRSKISMINMILGCLVKSGRCRFSIFICCKCQYIPFQTAGRTLFLHAILGFCSSCKGKGMCRLSGYFRVGICHFHGNTDLCPLINPECQGILIDSFPFSFQSG